MFHFLVFLVSRLFLLGMDSMNSYLFISRFGFRAFFGSFLLRSLGCGVGAMGGTHTSPKEIKKMDQMLKQGSTPQETLGVLQAARGKSGGTGPSKDAVKSARPSKIDNLNQEWDQNERFSSNATCSIHCYSQVTVRSQSGHSRVTVRSQSGHVF